MSFDIHPMTLADYEEVYTLWSTTSGIGISDADTRPNIARYLDQNPTTCFVAREEGVLAGAALSGHDGRRAYLHHLAVAPAFRRRGLGKKLVQACLDALKEQGMTRCHIFVYTDNHEGQLFWEGADWYSRENLMIRSHDM
jgi:ribosomal protein S18 acetylase RimI-like enzyme